MKNGVLQVRLAARDSIAVASAVSLLFTLIVPLQSFLSNAASFPLSVADVLTGFSLCFLASATTISLPLWLLARRNKWWGHLLCLGVLLAGLAESGVLSIGLPEMNGDLDRYSSVGRMVVDGLILAALFSLPFVFSRITKAHLSFISLILAIYSSITLFDVKKSGEGIGNGTLREIRLSEEKGYAIPFVVPREDVVKCAQYANGTNIFVLIVDSTSNDVVQDLFRGNPALAEKFPGFVNYVNNVGMHWATQVAIPGIFTGKYYENSHQLCDYCESQYKKESFIREYLERDIPTFVNIGPGRNGFTNVDAVPQDGIFDTTPVFLRAMRSRMAGAFAWSIWELSAFRLAPYCLKAPLMKPIMESWGWISLIDQDITSDNSLWRTLSEADVNMAWPMALHVHHTHGLHPPIVFGKNGRPSSIANGYDAYIDAGVFVFSEIGKFLDALRKAGIYDDATIIILGDHAVHQFTRPGRDLKGVPQDAFPFLLVKPARETAPYCESTRPTSHSGVADIVKESVDRMLSKSEIESLLCREERIAIAAWSDEIRIWKIDASGNVDFYTRPDRELTLDELSPIDLMKRYSFVASSMQSEYPDFIVENGSRNWWTGVALDAGISPEMTLKFCVKDVKTPHDIFLSVSFEMPLENEDCEVAFTTNGGTAEHGAIRPNQTRRFCISGVSADEQGIISITLKTSLQKGMLVLNDMRAALSSTP